MRELKFRSPHFSYKDNKFVGFSYWGPTEGGWTYHSSWTDTYRGDDQQYTGLHDKKRTEEYPEGQEIYEGDVVQQELRSPFVPKTLEPNPPILVQQIMRWDNEHGRWGLYTVGHLDKIRSGFGVQNAYQLEVIGNIDENPELIDG